MCGIFGYLGDKPSSFNCNKIIESLNHRGPDANGIKKYNAGKKHATFCHTRLSIIDLNILANQPFENKKYSLIYNGEIYNYLDIKKELEDLGVKFKTSSDTEVFLEAFTKWKHDAFLKFRGMFSAALLDKSNGILTLVQDPFGMKPLYIHESINGDVYFSSELKPFFVCGIQAKINKDVFSSSMLFMFVPPNISSFKNIYKLQPGHFLEISPKKKLLRKYFNHLNDNASDFTKSNSIEVVRNAIEESVKKHLISDVNVGSFLSGGLDSSILTVLAKKYLGSVEAYTIVNTNFNKSIESMPQDIIFARRLAKKENIKLNEIELKPNIDQIIPKMINILGEPISDPATYNVMLMSEQAKKNGIKVLLSGIGADEIFGGYRRHKAMMVMNKFKKIPFFLKKNIHKFIDQLPVEIFGHGLAKVRWAKRFLSFAALESDSKAYLRSYTYYDKEALSNFFYDNKTINLIELIENDHESIFNESNNFSLQNKMSYVDMHYFLPSLNLLYSDRSGMSESIEIRTPFVDKEIAKLGLSICGKNKVSMFHTKQILKKASESWLPKDIIYRPKASFGAPLRAWFRGPLKNSLDDILSGHLVSNKIIKQDPIIKMINAFDEKKSDYSYQFWHLLFLEHWYRWARGLGAYH